MDTAVLTLRGRGDRREGETDVSRQRPATCIRCQVLPSGGQSKTGAKQRKQHHRPSAEAAAGGGG